jgi:hypothetical protein
VVVVERLYKWERLLLKEVGTPVPVDAKTHRTIKRIFERDDMAKGWKDIAFVLGVHERNARLAYKDDPDCRRYIHKTGGRYWAEPGGLLNLRANVLTRREGGVARRHCAATRKRGVRGRFA